MQLPPPDLQLVLRRIAQLLRDDGYDGWATTLLDLADTGWRTSDEGRRKIRSFYGGIGSLNDLFLQKDGKPHDAENRELDRLRRKLFDLSLTI